ncbi:monolysocardiolipin acyltransferase [Cryptococcus neoformans C23]|uniref:Tafazzin family protein n=2 Tax=Cryptococcus neoformans TaxID=5207 RepID=A0A854QPR0_CRYNE|nr:monolysocardiolipin acyltransferase [Cryptococcus neoformans var. grubii H99]AUB22849.1 monolysocardiolipin acyltransferase [Cryptococcus neoformans var. grubii]OWZ34719.1 monolysocardiolipin acyltransferase [Cryptococcus neoformans var. grubii AD2-60a]OWZ46818.1 monolysocardiolipin acyltransferase [Cryptococcus neoformans var. grubii C23]OWZ50608.1 monolysocardiolipin acyltransferase [Cryptococcus neoformans var. grubii AD1-83a]OWZ56413.1 monolysocardiolipin acyltransferase [Cryptococcus n|eukprot:XP_012047238.1 monolysocardiolipin acyltransferase [Cryptococcus neoformans var. grubii H99]
MSPPSLASALTLSTIGLASRSFLRLTTKEFKVEGLPILLDALNIPHGEKGKGKIKADDGSDPSLKPRRGILTICNHNSVVDDPMMWSLLPLSTYFPFASPSHTCRNNRWTLGASDIMFTNSVHSKFFNLGQVIETHRGAGIFQEAIDRAVKLLQEGNWIHIFPEGKVNQQLTNPEGGLLRFKWGVGRIVMDSEIMPEIIPMWISGFDQIMPETRGFPRFVPRPGANISITVGQPLTSQIQPLVKAWKDMASEEKGTLGIGGEWEQKVKGEGLAGQQQREVRNKGQLIHGREKEVRIKIVEALQEGMRKLGQDVERREGRFKRGLWSHSTRQPV